MTKLLRPPRARRDTRRRPPPVPRAVPRLEPLEDRRVLNYGFRPVAFLDTPAPGGTIVRVFEPYGINEHGDLLYATDVEFDGDPATSDGQGVYLEHNGQTSLLARAGLPGPDAGAPGDRTFGPSVSGSASLNDPGDAAFI